MGGSDFWHDLMVEHQRLFEEIEELKRQLEESRHSERMAIIQLREMKRNELKGRVLV